MITQSLVYVTMLLSMATHGAAAVSAISALSFEILGPSGAALESLTPKAGEVKHIDLRSSTSIEMSFKLDDSASQASVIVQRRTGDDKNIVVFASPVNGRANANFAWDSWKSRFGDIEQGTEFDVSIAVWGADESSGSSGSSARRTDVALLTYVDGPTSSPTPGKVPLTTRITEAVASMSQKPEIIHMFRPEEKMIPAPVSYACALVVLAPVVSGMALMSKYGTESGSSQRAKLLSTMFYGSIILTIAAELAFWFGAVNLMEVFPMLVLCAVGVISSGRLVAKAKLH